MTHARRSSAVAPRRLVRPWASPLGWALASVIAALYLTAIMLLERSGRVTPATAVSELAATPLAVHLPLGELPDAPEQRGDTDATALLLETARLVGADVERYLRFLAAPAVATGDIPALLALDGVLEQASLASAPSWGQMPERHVAYRTQHPEVERLALAGRALNRVALHDHQQGRNADAARGFYATLSLGHKLLQHRTTYAELSTGLGLMSEAVTGLRLVFGDRPVLMRLLDQLRLEGERTLAVWTAISTVDGELVSRHNGDVCHIATHSNERVWRVEATLKLGRMKFDVGVRGTPADQRRARRLIQQLRSDPDPAVAFAARLASELTLEDYRTLR